jgi:hypothetical protein
VIADLDHSDGQQDLNSIKSKKSDPDPHQSESWVKIFKSGLQQNVMKNFGSGISDKHPGSATLAN